MLTLKKQTEDCRWSTWLSLASLILMTISTGYLIFTSLVEFRLQMATIESLTLFLTHHAATVAGYVVFTLVIYLLIALLYRKNLVLAIQFTLEYMPALRQLSESTQNPAIQNQIDTLLTCHDRLIHLGRIHQIYLILLFWGLLPLYAYTHSMSLQDTFALTLVLTTLVIISVADISSFAKQTLLIRASDKILRPQLSTGTGTGTTLTGQFQTPLSIFRIMAASMILTWIGGILLALNAFYEVGQTLPRTVHAWNFIASELAILVITFIAGYLFLKHLMQFFKAENDLNSRPLYLIAEMMTDTAQYSEHQKQQAAFLLESDHHIREMAWGIRLFVKLQFFFTFPLLALGCIITNECEIVLVLFYMTFSLITLQVNKHFYTITFRKVAELTDHLLK